MTTRLTELRKLAEEATPGPWRRIIHNWHSAVVCEAQYKLLDNEVSPNVRRLSDSAFIAAANPAAIIELLAVVEKMRDVLESIARREEYPIAKAAYALAALEKWGTQ